MDLSYNAELDDNLEYHQVITEAILDNEASSLTKIHITTSQMEVKSHYLEVLD